MIFLHAQMSISLTDYCETSRTLPHGTVAWVMTLLRVAASVLTVTLILQRGGLLYDDEPNFCSTLTILGVLQNQG